MTQNKINTSQVLKQYVSTMSATAVSCPTDFPEDNTIPQNTEGDEVLTISITPISASSTLEIEFGAQSGTTVTGMSGGIWQDTTANALTASDFEANQTKSMVIVYTMTSGTTSSTTFKARMGVVGGTLVTNSNDTNRIMGGVMRMWFTIKEYL